jgi:hypothetical protein
VFQSPLEDFKKEVAAAGLENRVTYLDRGEAYTFQPALIETEAEPIAAP